MHTPPLESKVEARLFRGVKRLGGSAIKIKKRAGYPDRIIMVPSRIEDTCRFLFVEVKRDNGRLAEHQQVAHAELRAMHAEVRTVYGYKDVDALIKELERWQTTGLS